MAPWLASLCRSLTAGWCMKPERLCLECRWRRLPTSAWILQLIHEVWKAYLERWRHLPTCACLTAGSWSLKGYVLTDDDFRCWPLHESYSWFMKSERLIVVTDDESGCWPARVLQLVYEVWKVISCIVTDDDTSCWPVHESCRWFMYRPDKSVMVDWTLKTNYLFIPWTVGA